MVADESHHWFITGGAVSMPDELHIAEYDPLALFKSPSGGGLTKMGSVSF